MSDSQKIGMTDGDDSQELQPTCMRAFDGWISVDDKKPKILEHVICTNALGRVFEACYWSEGEFASVYLMGKFGVMAKPDDSVTHWRPLPPPPVK